MGITRVYRQRGHGLGSILAGFAKKGLATLGKSALKTGLQTMDRVSKGESWKNALKSSAKNQLSEIVGQGAQRLMGSINKRGRKRKSNTSKSVAFRDGASYNLGPPAKKTKKRSKAKGPRSKKKRVVL